MTPQGSVRSDSASSDGDSSPSGSDSDDSGGCQTDYKDYIGWTVVRCFHASEGRFRIYLVMINTSYRPEFCGCFYSPSDVERVSNVMVCVTVKSKCSDGRLSRPRYRLPMGRLVPRAMRPRFDAVEVWGCIPAWLLVKDYGRDRLREACSMACIASSLLSRAVPDCAKPVTAKKEFIHAWNNCTGPYKRRLADWEAQGELQHFDMDCGVGLYVHDNHSMAGAHLPEAVRQVKTAPFPTPPCKASYQSTLWHKLPAMSILHANAT